MNIYKLYNKKKTVLVYFRHEETPEGIQCHKALVLKEVHKVWPTVWKASPSCLPALLLPTLQPPSRSLLNLRFLPLVFVLCGLPQGLSQLIHTSLLLRLCSVIDLCELERIDSALQRVRGKFHQLSALLAKHNCSLV